MTRINAGIPVEELSDKHLLAEHREIKRIPNMVTSGKAKLEIIPKEFTLGKGHVKFFYDKNKFTYNRYCLIYSECKRRGFNVEWYGGAWNLFILDHYQHLNKDWEPTPEANELIRQRIKERNNV